MRSACPTTCGSCISPTKSSSNVISILVVITSLSSLSSSHYDTTIDKYDDHYCDEVMVVEVKGQQIRKEHCGVTTKWWFDNAIEE